MQGDGSSYIRWFEDLSSEDVASVGGKNASLGEMIRSLGEKGVRVPGGFATTAQAYWAFIEANGIAARLREELAGLESGEQTLQEAGRAIRRLFCQGRFPEALAEGIRSAYRELSRRFGVPEVDVAVRSSATAEDLPEASFAGQQETFLNVRGEEELLDSCRSCFASLFTDRAISYRQDRGFDHLSVALSVGVQKMVRSDKAGAGVMFTLDTESGFPGVVVINAAWGLGETVVQGRVNPDEYQAFKPLLEDRAKRPIIEKLMGAKERKMVYATGGTQTTKEMETTAGERHSFVLTDDEILQLARWGVAIEEHYGRPMDIEWAKDGDTNELFIVQARPETVQSQREATSLKTFTLLETAEPILSGLAIGQAIASGRVNVIESPQEMGRFQDDAILVTGMTDPDWVPIMRRAAGIITDHGGRTSHAAIVSRELGIPAIVGTGRATKVLKDGQEITMSCAEGDEGHVYEGLLQYEATEIDLSQIEEVSTPLMMNIGSPAASFRWWRLPTRGVGLARMEFVINNAIKVHPMALVEFDRLQDRAARAEIERLTEGYRSRTEYFVELLALGIAKIAASQYPNPVIVRMSDFKTNEYANLIGGRQFEPEEANPMLGFRGASRYYSDAYRPGFALECRAVKRAREEIGLDNVVVMIPFCRTPEEADRVLEVMAENGLRRGENGLQVYVMAEVPSNVTLADRFSERFDGFSIGSNDLTQFVLAVDRDSAALAHLFDETHEAVKRTISELIRAAHAAGRKVSICGEAPSNHPEFAVFLVEEGIDSISLEPDSVVPVMMALAERGRSRRREAAR
ncbi:MAG: phosphoenolpyruvate synthase [Anaerolineae bacterium]|nr:phosphoenolpyruvate synthase [Anaerolineae bacterium]